MRNPFGKDSCENEPLHNYAEVYFDEAPFNEAAKDPNTYLIIGRRGAGKTAIARYLSFKDTLGDPYYLYAEDPRLYRDVLENLAADLMRGSSGTVGQLQMVWDYALWNLLLEGLKEDSPLLRTASQGNASVSSSDLLSVVIEKIRHFLRAETGSVGSILFRRSEKDFPKPIRDEILKLASERPIVLVIDTLEQYAIGDHPLLMAVAALIQAAAVFNNKYAEQNLYIKVLMSGEIFPHLKADYIENTTKFVRDPVYLTWRPRDLLRVICWRFYHTLHKADLLHKDSKRDIDWSDPGAVLKHMWIPYFGETVTNKLGAKEPSFDYLLRHTQLRPRQLILMCNAIAENAIRDKTFPHFEDHHVRSGVQHAEFSLAEEIFNSFKDIRPQVQDIVDGLNHQDVLISMRDLQRIAKTKANIWHGERFSPDDFIRLMMEIGVLGRVVNQADGVVHAEYEYLRRDPLVLHHDDVCAIHPIFSGFLDVKNLNRIRVVPFSQRANWREPDA